MNLTIKWRTLNKPPNNPPIYAKSVVNVNAILVY